MIDLSSFDSKPVDDLFAIFDEINRKLNIQCDHLLILEKKLSQPINFLTPFSTLQKVTRITKVIWLENLTDETLQAALKEFTSIVFFCEDSLQNVGRVAKLFRSTILPITETNSLMNISLITLGSLNQSIRLYLSELSLENDIDYYSWDPILFRIDSDLLSLNSSSDLKKLYQLQSIEPLYTLANGLLQLVIHSNFKLRFTNKFIKGANSAKFYDIYQKLYTNYTLNKLSPERRKILEDVDETLFMDIHSFYNNQCDLFVFERSVDFITPLLTQLTYSGLVHDNFNVEYNTVNLKSETIPLNDELYQEIKDLNFTVVGSLLNSKAKSLQESFEERHKAKDIAQIKNFVSNLTNLTKEQQSLKNHTNLAEAVLAKVHDEAGNSENPSEDSLFNQFLELQQDILSNKLDNKTTYKSIQTFLCKYNPPPLLPLRLMILSSIVKNGIRDHEFNALKKDFVDYYGVDYLPVINTLAELSLLTSKKSQPLEQNANSQLIKDFHNLSIFLNLLPGTEETNLLNPTELDFALPGFVPIITRLIQSVYTRSFIGPNSNPVIPYIAGSNKKYNWKGLDIINTYLTGTMESKLLIPKAKEQIFTHRTAAPSHSRKGVLRNEEYIIVVMLGGISYGELSTLRVAISKINESMNLNKKLLVLTSSVLKSDDIIKLAK
ncbi:BA75_02151T0 [Komagataella pastoris]|uniref:BA75_02151T0 n=1 Tax=Komagataella pastoris TaxID=4922 RepID=A0A1B2JDD2_PICPA|nr:BA75_02151T0 [Komagataella pastoris]